MEIKNIILFCFDAVTKEVKGSTVYKNNLNLVNNLFIRKEEQNA